jgi:hypothetical protein
MDGYYVVGVTPIPYYPRYRCIITIVSKEEKTYLVSIANILNALARTLQNVVFGSGKEGSVGFMQALVLCVQVFVQG